MHNKALIIVSLLLALSLIFAGSSFSMAVDKNYIIGFKQPPGQVEKGILKDHGGKVKRQFGLLKAMAASVPTDAVAKLKKNPKVAYVEEDQTVMLVEPILGGVEYENAWGVARIGAAQAHSQGITGAGIKVAVIDTGIDYSHPELAGNYKGGVNFITAADDYDDSYNSHGTHVAGIIAAASNDTGVIGVAPAAELYAVKVLDGAGFGPTSSLLAGIEWAILNDMDIANISIGYSEYSQAMDDACQLAADAGILLVAAAGNNYGAPVVYPAALDSVIAVTATMTTDEIYFKAALGPEVELAAPGVAVNSTIAGGSYNILTGTSQAAPHVAGAAALLMSAGVSDLNGDGFTDAKDVRIQLQGTAGDLGALGKDETFGYGLVSAIPASPASPSERLLLSADKNAPDSGAQTVTLNDGLFHIEIQNDSLRELSIDIYSDGTLVPELSTAVSFVPKKVPSTATLSLDASSGALEASFIPKGKKGSFAEVLIQQTIAQ